MGVCEEVIGYTSSLPVICVCVYVYLFSFYYFYLSFSLCIKDELLLSMGDCRIK